MKKLSILLFIIALSSFKQQTNGTLTINTSDFNNDSGKAVLKILTLIITQLFCYTTKTETEKLTIQWVCQANNWVIAIIGS